MPSSRVSGFKPCAQARRGLLFLCGFAVCLGAWAQAAPVPQRWAALSLVGDQLTVVTRADKVGNLGDTNARTSLPVPDKSFDRQVLAALSAAMSASKPGVELVMFLPTDARQYLPAQALFSGAQVALDGAIVEAIRASGAQYLLLVSKRRAEASFKLANEHIGGGWLEGLGFYIDRDTALARTDTLTGGLGFLAPYAYLNVAVVEVAGLRRVVDANVQSSVVLPATSDAAHADPWVAVPAAKKADALAGLIQHHVAAAARRALADLPAAP